MVTPGPTGRVTVTCSVLVAAAPLLSITVTLKDAVPGAAGVPDKVPSDARVSPAGRLDANQKYGCVPPETASLVVRAVPSKPLAMDDVVMLRGAPTVTGKGTLAVSPFASVAVT